MSRPPAPDLTGQVFGRLTVVEDLGLLPYHDRRRREYRLRCSCGQETQSDQYTLLRGYKRSCGCLRSEVSARQTMLNVSRRRRGVSGGWRFLPPDHGDE